MRPATCLLLLSLLLPIVTAADPPPVGISGCPERETVLLRSQRGHGGASTWRMAKLGDVPADGAALSAPAFDAATWREAIVPGTVLNTLVADGVYPEPYFGLNNARELKRIPDIFETGPAFYTCWFRTTFTVPASFAGRRVWMQLDGINYQAAIWVNGRKVGDLAGMFQRGLYDLTAIAKPGEVAALAVLVHPIDPANGFKAKRTKPLAVGENRNGADGTIGQFTTMLMTAGWDFTFADGIRDRNTGIWRDVKLFATGPVALRHPFVRCDLPIPDTSSARTRINVEVVNASDRPQEGVLRAVVADTPIAIEQAVTLAPGETRIVTFTPEEHAALVLKNPILWWPFNKGGQHLYRLETSFVQGAVMSDRLQTRFGVRDIRSNQDTPDRSRQFIVNGKRLFLHGSNWIPEAMCRGSEERTWAELRYTRQAGVNFLRFWAGGVTESDLFFDLCDELGILVWTEFWQSGDTQIPKDQALYRANVEDTVKRIRNHPGLAYWVSANERDAKGIVPIADILERLDGSRGYQVGSETDGIHDGSPYVACNPMWYYENTASARGSRIDGLCPEYGCPILPTIDCLRETMDEKDLWPIDKVTWDYLDGGGFHGMTGDFRRGVEQYGPSQGIEEYAWKAQMFGALSYRAIWECWNANRFDYGDRFTTGLLFWYHNSPHRQVCGRLYDWSLEPTAALYFSQDAHEPRHAQFDFLKNTVSVNNELPEAFPGCTVTLRVLDLDMTERLNRRVTVDLGADRLMKDVMTVALPATLSPVHIIRLDLADAQGRAISDTFYWRSDKPYTPKRSWSGCQFEGFAALSSLPMVALTTSVTAAVVDGRTRHTVTVSNPGRSLAFMVWLRLQHADTGKPVRPAFYDDNFISLMPGESRTIAIESSLVPAATQLVVDGWNVERRVWHAGAWKELPPLTRTRPAPTSLSRGCVATASSIDKPELVAANAVDGDAGTRWASARSDDQWLAIDLGAARSVSRVTLHWESAYAKEYRIEGSDDGREWRELLQVTDGAGGVEERSFPAVTIRHLRVHGVKRATAYGYSLFACDVWP